MRKRIKSILREEFEQMASVPSEIMDSLSDDVEYMHDKQADVLMLYDGEKDVHYFFVRG